MDIDDDMVEGEVKKRKIPKAAKVKNKMPAPVQITAEQIIREAKERELELIEPPPKQKISSPAELHDFQMRKRKEFEDMIRRNRGNIGIWLRYAAWEETQKDLQRARSIYERALDVDHRSIPIWLKYADMEMRNGQVNHSRNLWDRAVTLMPRAAQLWYKYVYMEEVLGNPAGARQVFERWMNWLPEPQAWHTYLNFEMRHQESERARAIYERFVQVHPEVKNWIKYARFEQKRGRVASARSIYERAIEFFGDENLDPQLVVAFAQFEESQHEFERAQVIYKFALDKLPKEQAEDVLRAYTVHQKRFGDRRALESAVYNKRKVKYEAEINENPHNYDTWFDYARLLEEEAAAFAVPDVKQPAAQAAVKQPYSKVDSLEAARQQAVEAVRELYERAIAQVPPIKEKRYWRRYIYLWIYYAVFEELVTADIDRARQVWETCLKVIPHKQFTFAKIWLQFAMLEVRQKEVTRARKILGAALGKCPKPRLYKGYIELEIKLREFDRCRTLYEKFLEFQPENCETWIKFAELEMVLGDTERSRAIYELAITQPRLDMPELVWKSYLDSEISSGNLDYARKLYRRLLERTQHVKVWLSMAQFELSSGKTEAASISTAAEPEQQPSADAESGGASSEAMQAAIQRARAIYREANDYLRKRCRQAEPDAVRVAQEERIVLLEAWRTFELENGTRDDAREVSKLLPDKVKRRRKVLSADGSDAGWEEYFEYVFPDLAEAQRPNLRLLLQAKKWKELGAKSSDAGDGASDGQQPEAEEPSEPTPPSDADAAGEKKTPDEAPPATTASDTLDSADANVESPVPAPSPSTNPDEAPALPSHVSPPAAIAADESAPSIASLRSRFLSPDDSS